MPSSTERRRKQVLRLQSPPQESPVMIEAVRNPKPGLATRSAPAPVHELSEYYQEIVRRLRQSENGSVEGPQVVGITSCTRGEEVSTVATNLAMTAAASGQDPVLLVDANVARPALNRNFNIWNLPGVVEVLHESADPLASVQDTTHDNLYVLPAGNLKGHAGRSYESDRIVDVLTTLRREFSLIVFDLPAVEDLGSCFSLAGKLDGVLLVVEAERVRSHVAVRAKQKLEECHAHLIGAVFNKRRKHLPGWLYHKL